jgi:hypothetical protein
MRSLFSCLKQVFPILSPRQHFTHSRTGDIQVDPIVKLSAFSIIASTITGKISRKPLPLKVKDATGPGQGLS